MTELERFPDEIHDTLKYYIYRLIDPRNGETFYIGKGRGNRVFTHVAGALKFEEGEDATSEKIQRIHQIQNVGLQPFHVIHRHGMTEEQALLAESVLIDATPGLSNLVRGHGSDMYGPASAAEIVSRYQLAILTLQSSHKVLAINIGTTYEETSIYEAVRCAWRINVRRAADADYIFATHRGVCRDVFIAEQWLPALREHFPRLSTDAPERWGFVGLPAPDEIRSLYAGKRLPPELQRRRGAATPIMYFF